METTTDDLTLHLGPAALAPACLSSVIDLWDALRGGAAEALQTPPP